MIVKTQITKEVLNGVTVYGISVTTDKNHFNYKGLTENNIEIENLSRRLKESDVDSIHIDDIIRDFVLGNAYDRLILNNL